MAASQSQDCNPSPEFVGRTCEESCARMQLVADLLLLKTGNRAGLQENHRLSVLEPVSGEVESYGKLRDEIIATTKVLAISIKEFKQHMKIQHLSGVSKSAERVAKQAIQLTETAASAAYYAALTDIQCKPAKQGPIDLYLLERAKQELHISYNKFRPDYDCPSTVEYVLDISKSFADNLALLSQCCLKASENKKISNANSTQFATCYESLQGGTAAFLTALKAFASRRTEDNRKKCLLFGRPLLSIVDSLVEFSSFPQFSGKPAILTEKGHESQIDILGGAMAIISSCIQLLGAARSILCEQIDKSSRWEKLNNSLRAVADSIKLLCTSIREHTPLPSRRPSTDFT